MSPTFQDGQATNPALADLIIRVDQDLRSGATPAPKVAATVSDMLNQLNPSEFASDLELAAQKDGYAQHCVHLDPEGRFSIIMLVWKSGQFTPVHNHRTWGVITVLEGAERETMFEVVDGTSDDPKLRGKSDSTYRPGEVAWFIPPEDIHVVEAEGAMTASMHIYGCDYRDKPTSILRSFDGAIDHHAQ